jgi:hypothetical protein
LEDFKRRNFLIYPQFQLALILTQFFVMGGVLGLIGYQMLRSYERLREAGAEAGLNQNHVFYNLLAYQEDIVRSYLFAALFFGWAVSFVTTLILSHKLAGPIVRLKWYFQQIAKTGHAKPVHFRKSDFMQDLPPIINQALQKLESGEKEKRKSA